MVHKELLARQAQTVLPVQPAQLDLQARQAAQPALLAQLEQPARRV